MKFKKYIGALLMGVIASMGFTACQDDVNAPGLVVPKATITANTTIADLKATYWDDAANYIDTIKVANADQHIVISGRVISSDASGNIYKSLVIQDPTGALALSINANSLYNDYRIGQEVVIDVTDMYIGKYSSLQQLGFPDFSAGYGWQATFMPLEFFREHAQLNGLPEPAAVDTLTISIPDLSNDAATLRKYQSQLVRFNNVHFKEGGEVTFCTAHKENTNRTLVDANGNELIVRTSGYANFWSMKVPAETGSVVGILSTYYSSGETQWQLLLRSTSDLMYFGKGTETNPFEVLDAVSASTSSSAITGWFTGFIVGAPKAGVNEITSVDDIQWTAEEEGGMFLLSNSLIIGQTADAHSLADVMLVTLPSGTAMQTYGNLFDHPELVGRQMWFKGSTSKEMGIAAVTDCPGTVNDFRIEGVTVPVEPSGELTDGTGTEESPYTAAQVVAKGNAYTENNVWVTGYIVGWIDNKTQSFANENNTHFDVPATVATNILIANDPNETDYTKCAAVNLPSTDGIRAAINLVDNPGNLHKLLTVKGNIIKYFTLPGVKEVTAYKLDGQSGGGGDQPGPDVPGTPVTSLDESFSAGSLPSGWTIKTTSGNKDWFFSNYGGRTFAMANAYQGTAGADGFEAWLITPPVDMNGVTNKNLSFESAVGFNGSGDLEVYVLTTNDPATATKTKLNATVPAPSGSWSEFSSSGNLSLANFNGTVYIGFRYKSASSGDHAARRVTAVKLGQAGGTGGGDEPNPPVTGTNTADFNTLPVSSSYKTVTTEAGWVCKNCAIQQGGDKDSNPMFKCIGSADTRAVCINGKKGSAGSIVSPVLTGGIKSLSFNFGFMFGEGNYKPVFKVMIKQNGATVAEEIYTCDNTTKFEVQTYTMTCNVTGNFEIEIVNQCAGGQTSGNKERISIWNLTWTN